MKIPWTFAAVILLSLGAAGGAAAQEAAPDRVSAAFSDPARPGRLKVNVLQGSITVKGYEGKEVVVEARVRAGRSSRAERGEAPGGMRRITNTATGLTVEEENNVMSVSVSAFTRTVDVNIQVPLNTSLKLSSTNDGDIKVERVRGEIEVNNVNGAVALSNVSGSVVAHALNGNLVVTLDEVAPDKPMSFSSLNGNIDVTLPAATKANVTMQSDFGEIYSDFEIQLRPTSAQPVMEGGKGGRQRIRVDKAMRGAINGGGPEYQLKNFNGNIYIRKKG